MSILKTFLPFVLGWLAIAFSVQAQTVKVIDDVSGDPIVDVLIYTPDFSSSVYSNKKGEANLQDFSDSVLYFQHSAYQTTILPFDPSSESQLEVKLNPSEISLDEVVVIGSGREERLQEIPRRIMSIDQKSIEFSNAQTTADLLTNSGQVYVQKSQMGGGSPMMRGMSANRILLSIDQVRMNNAIYRSGNLQNVINIDQNAIARSEVIFGPGTMIYGSDAMGGVISFKTKDVHLQAGEQPYSFANGMVRYASANKENTLHVDFGAGYKKWGSLTSITVSQFDDLRMGSDGPDDYLRPFYVERINGQDVVVQNEDPELQVPTGYSQWNLMQKFRIKPDENHDIELFLHYSTTSDIPRYDRLILTNDNLPTTDGGQPTNAEWYYGPQEWLMGGFSLSKKKETRLYDRYKIIGAYQYYQESRYDRRFGSNDLRERTETVNMVTLTYDLDKQLSERSRLHYGLDWYYNDVASTATSTDIESGEVNPEATRYPDGGSDLNSLALYAIYKTDLTESLKFSGGLRGTYQQLISRFDDKTFYDFPFDVIDTRSSAINGSLGLNYNVNKKWIWSAALASGFRAPNVDDMGKVFDSEPGNVVVPNEDLQPEYIYNLDVGVNFVGSEHLQFRLDVYYSYLTNAIVRDDADFNGLDSIMYSGELSNVLTLVNKDHATIYGIHAGLQIVPAKSMVLKLDYSLNRGEDSDGLPLRHVSPDFGSAHMIYSPRRMNFDFYVLFNQELSNSELAPSEQSKSHLYAKDSQGLPYAPAWYTLNFKSDFRVLTMVSLGFGVENILDKRYRNYSSGLTAGGRNYVLSMRGKF